MSRTALVGGRQVPADYDWGLEYEHLCVSVQLEGQERIYFEFGPYAVQIMLEMMHAKRREIVKAADAQRLKIRERCTEEGVMSNTERYRVVGNGDAVSRWDGAVVEPFGSWARGAFGSFRVVEAATPRAGAKGRQFVGALVVLPVSKVERIAS